MPHMYYTNFDIKITQKYGVVVEGWPLQKFCSPSDLRSRLELDVLYRAWESGSARFRKLSRDEYIAWDNVRLEETLHTCETVEGATMPTSEPPASAATSFPSTFGSEPAANNSSIAAMNLVAPHAGPSVPAGHVADVAIQDGSSAERIQTRTGEGFIHLVSGAGGGLVNVTKKARAPRKDKGQPRKKKAAVVQESPQPSGSIFINAAVPTPNA